VQKMAVTVKAVNDAPTLANFSGSVGYTRGDTAILLAAFATVKDPDSPDFSGGKLSVEIVAGEQTANRLQVGGAFSFSNGKLLRDGVTIGTISGNGIGLNKLEFAFNTQATANIVQELMRSIRFRTISGATAGDRRISFSLSDGDGGTSAALEKTVRVS
jgi:hypothetical protein